LVSENTAGNDRIYMAAAYRYNIDDLSGNASSQTQSVMTSSISSTQSRGSNSVHREGNFHQDSVTRGKKGSVTFADELEQR